MEPGRPDIALGRYRLGSLLGRGATSSVYAASDVHTGRPVAVKTIPASPELLARIEVEIRAAQRLEHPNIVRLLDWGRGSGLVYLVWELIDGPSLGHACAERRPTTGWATLRMIEVLAALDHAHSRGIVHRDVKPENILIDADGHARLADFGVARLTDHATMTSAGSLVGTIAYMSPEQARAHTVGPPSDVYSACIVLYELLVGSNPLAGGSAAETARRAAMGSIPPLGEVRPDLPPRLAAAVMSGLVRNPDERPSARALERELEAAISGARETELRQQRVRRIREPMISLLATGLATAGVLIGLSHLGPGEIAIGAGAAGAIALRWPRLAAGVVAAAAVALIGRTSIGAAILMGAGLAAILLTGWQWPRHLGAPLVAVAAAWVGLLPLACMLSAGLRSTRERVWAICSGLLVTAGWELWSGRPLLLGPAAARPASQVLAHVKDPAEVINRVHTLVGGSWWLVWGAAGLAVAALAAPLVIRARPGGQRVLASIGWAVGLGGVAVVGLPDPTVGLAAVGPSAILIVVWALRPWRTLGRMGSEPTSATLRGPI
jgi:hypothetical protein